MFYKLIEKKRNDWLASEECTIKELLQYIVQRGMMRDAQLEAIKTYHRAGRTDRDCSPDIQH